MSVGVSDPVAAFRAIAPSASTVSETAELGDLYAYGIEPLPDGDLVMTAERDARPVLARIGAMGELKALHEVATRYRGISASATTRGCAEVLTYDTVPGNPDVLLERFDISGPGEIRRLSAMPLEIAPTVLRIYDVGTAAWRDGAVLAVVALVADAEGRALREDVFLFERGAGGFRFGRTLPALGALNELRSISLFTGDDGCVHAVGCRRFWLADEAFLFRVLPDEELLDCRSFECRGGDFQQAGMALDGEGRMVLACIHRHRRDIGGIRYNIETFGAP